MGREIKRVALGFDWPMGKVWEGYLNPHRVRQCPDCEVGYSRAYHLVSAHLNDLMWDSAALRESAEYRQITAYLAGREPSGFFGHDSTDAWQAVKELGRLAGLPKGWHTCSTCKGTGEDPTDKATARLRDRWKETEPPVGDGYQLWETVSEGAPVSPVFATPEALATWLAEHQSGIHKTTYEGWLQFINGPGWAPSMMVSQQHGVESGVESVVRETI